MQFDWDPAKAKANLAKHGISFPQATAIFSDLDAIDVPDPHEGEERSRIIGYAGAILLTVIYTERRGLDGKLVQRLISARRATRAERRTYEEED